MQNQPKAWKQQTREKRQINSNQKIQNETIIQEIWNQTITEKRKRMKLMKNNWELSHSVALERFVPVCWNAFFFMLERFFFSFWNAFLRPFLVVLNFVPVCWNAFFFLLERFFGFHSVVVERFFVTLISLLFLLLLLKVAGLS